MASQNEAIKSQEQAYRYPVKLAEEELDWVKPENPDGKETATVDKRKKPSIETVRRTADRDPIEQARQALITAVNNLTGVQLNTLITKDMAIRSQIPVEIRAVFNKELAKLRK